VRVADLPDDLRKQMGVIFGDPERFIRMLWIPDKASSKRVRFEPNLEQMRLLEEVQNRKRVIVLKPRQIGVSTLLRAYALWEVYKTDDPVKFGVISFHDRSAKHLRKMDNTLLSSLPKLLHRDLSIDNSTTLEFADTEATLCSYTAGSKGGTRSFTLTAAHLSEFAFYDDPGELLAQVTATVGSGQIIIESTANMSGDAFHRLVQGCPENGWHLVTFWWWEHERYRMPAPRKFRLTDEEAVLGERYGLDNEQLYWRRQQIATLGKEKFRREYPACMDDAFFFASSTYFDADDLLAIEALPFTDRDRVYEEPVESDCYAMGVDVAAGVGSDYSAITIVSLSTHQPVYHYRNNKISPTDFADVVVKMAQKYHNAKVLCESNNHGHVVLYRMRHMGYKNLWLSYKGMDWITSVKTKLDAYETLREYVGSGMITALDMQVLAELRSLVVLRVTPEAPKGMHDDMAMSMALAYRCMRDIPRRVLTNARRKHMDMLISKTRASKMKETQLPWKVNI